MKKLSNSRGDERYLFKLTLKMKLTVFLTMVSLFQIQAHTYSQTKKVSLDMSNATVAAVIYEIESLSDFKFLLNRSDVDVDRTVSIKVKRKPIAFVLNEMFEGTDVEYEVLNKQIILRSKTDDQDTQNNEAAQNSLPDNTVQYQVSGTVVDENGQPLPGANVIEKGTTNGTQTDFEGNFELTLSDENATLQVSYIGFTTREVQVNGATTFNIVLEESTAGLDEVVLVGYGKLSKQNVTGSISSINSDDLEKFPSSSVEQSLRGKLSGVQLSQSSGQPGAGISIRVRGVTSISGGNEPLYVVDGIPFFNSDVRGLNGISAINPNDIESIQVLKDASATAIYGSRGANGVVLVTTKSGKSGTKGSVEYSTWLSVKNVRNELDLMSGDQFLDFQNRFYQNSELSLPTEIAEIVNANTDWQKEVFKTALTNNHNLSMSGGNDKNQYYASLNYLNEEGIVLNSDFKRISFRANLDSKINKTFSINSSVMYSNSVQNGFRAAENNNSLSFLSSGIGAVILAIPTEPVFDSDGTYRDVSTYNFTNNLNNPVQYSREVLDKTTVNKLLGSFTLETTILNGLNNYTRLGLDYQNRRGDGYQPTTLKNSEGSANVRTDERLNYLLENYFEYQAQVLPELDAKITLGGALQKETLKTISLGSSGFFSDQLTNNVIQAGTSIGIPNTNNIDQSIASGFFRVNLDYKDKYLLAGSVRSDGASVFSESNKVATFPSLSAGWKLSKENFLVNSKTVSDLKLRGSWGKSGNPGIRPYQSLPLGTIVITSQGAGSNVSTGLVPNLPNRTLTWETTEQTNIGLDLGLLDSRIRLSFDYYNKDTKDVLTSVQLPPSGGFATIIDNVGQVQNKGVEFTLGSTLVDKEDLSVSV